MPRPRRHLVTYHGVLAPAASVRSQIVPGADDEEEEDGVGGDGQQDDERALAEPGAEESGEARARRARVPHRPGKRRMGGRRYYTWAELLRRVFAIEIFTCPRCGGSRRLLAAIQDPLSIELRQSAPRQAGRVGAAGDGLAYGSARVGAGEGTAWW